MRLFVLFSFIFMFGFLSGCGKGAGNVSIANDSFHTSGTAEVLAVAPATTVSDFKVCIRKVRLEDENDETQKDKDDNEDIEFSPGLVDLTNGEPKEWGKVELPTGFKLKRIKVKVQKHVASCGVNYSLKFNDETTTRDIEFRFRFDPPVELGAGEKLKLSLSDVVAALRQAGDAGNLNRMHDYIEGLEGKASKE